MNTKAIQSTKPKSYPILPPLKPSNKLISKHFCNAALHLPRKQFVLLNWLVFQSGAANNQFTYSTHLLRQFSAYIEAIHEQYGGESIPTAIQLIRADLKELIEKGYIFPVKGKVFMINSMLVWGKKVSKGDLESAVELYQKRDIEGIINIFSKH